MIKWRLTRTAQEWEEKGNEEYKKGNWSEALSHYTNALKLAKKDNADKAVYYKNRAAVYLKIHEYEKVITDCDSALKISCNDSKTLFRRCQALEALERFEEAYQDTKKIILFDFNNKNVQLVAARLRKCIQKRNEKKSYIKAKVSQLIDLAFNVSADKNKRETAMNNLLVLARERDGAEEIFKKEGVSKIAQLAEVEKNEEIICSAIFIVSELCKNNISRTETIMKVIGFPWCLEMMKSTSTDRVKASENCLQTILNTYSGMNNEHNSKPDEALCAAHKKEIDTILWCLLYNITDRAITGLTRDTIIQFIIHNIRYTALDWAEQLVELDGLRRLLEVASEMDEYKYESSMDVTSSTQSLASCCLEKIYENMYYNVAKEKFKKAVDKFIEQKLLLSNIESKMRLVVVITILLLSPLDIGNAVLAKKGILEMILVLAETDDVLQQKVACECIVAAATKKDKSKAIIKQSVNILKKLCQSTNDSIQVRALVSLCKLGRSEDIDTTITLFEDGMSEKLAETCRRFLINPKKEKDIRKWAIKGLSYLTFDTEVKENFMEDQQSIEAMIEFAKTGNVSIFSVITTLVNLCDAHDQPELIPKMIEFKKFAKHHIRINRKVDSLLYERRQHILVKADVTSALVRLTTIVGRNQNAKELIARIFNVICSKEELREIVVRQDGSKVLLSLAQDGTYKGKKQAVQALARLGMTIHPEFAYLGEDNLEIIVRLFINFLNSASAADADSHFENLMALSKLANVNDNLRKYILKVRGFKKIVEYMNSYDNMIRYASAQVINNLIICDKVVTQYFEQQKDCVKYLLILLRENESKKTIETAAEALEMLTSVSEKACKKVFQYKDWLESLSFLLTNSNGDLQRMGIIIVLNMMRSTEDVAAKLIETRIMQLLTKLSINDTINDTIENEEIKDYAFFALDAAARWKTKNKSKKNVETKSSQTGNIT